MSDRLRAVWLQGFAVGLIVSALIVLAFPDRPSRSEIEDLAGALGMVYREDIIAERGFSLVLAFAEDTALDAAARTLAASGLASSEEEILRAARDAGLGPVIAAGTYRIEPPVTLVRVLARLAEGP